MPSNIFLADGRQSVTGRRDTASPHKYQDGNAQADERNKETDKRPRWQ